MEDFITPLSQIGERSDENRATNGITRPLRTSELPVPSINQNPPSELARAGWVLRTHIAVHCPHLIKERKFHLRTFRSCLVGSEMVDWLVKQGQLQHRIITRNQAVGMWHILLEEGVILQVATTEPNFQDKYILFRFREDQFGTSPYPSSKDIQIAEEEFQDVFQYLLQLAPDATFRLILGKPAAERTVEDLEIIYEELLQLNALTHLSNSVKRELAAVICLEVHPQSGTILFHQGDEGKSWYIILKGSVNVCIYGKGVVCTLHESDNFGKLALVNDAPRAATIVTQEDGCMFLRVDKEDFNRILRDVEANTVRLKEHGQDVLLLQKTPKDGHARDESHSHYKYTVIAGTPQKMLEHLLETRLDSRGDDYSDTFLEDFLLTHIIFMPSHHLCQELMKHYRLDIANSRQEKEFIITNKRKVVIFIQTWLAVVRESFFEDECVTSFLHSLLEAISEDVQKYGSLQDELKCLTRVMEAQENYLKSLETAGPQKWKVEANGQLRRLNVGHTTGRAIKASDEMVFRVYCADHTYTTIKTPAGATADIIKKSAAEKLGLKDELVLAEVRSTGERIVFKDTEVSIPTGLYLNSRIFLAPSEHIDSLTTLPEQDCPITESTLLDTLGSQDIAHQITCYDWELFSCIHEYELIYHVFGRHQFRKVMSNLDIYLRRFNEVQFWVVTEICLTTSLSRRVQLLRKFIKIAQYCREYKNMNMFFAVVMGLSNVAVSRLSQTWERLSGKLKKSFADFETEIDPSRNHRRYRVTVSKMAPPLLPFMPLLLKDMTFSHEGNKTCVEGLVNFEKMHMIAQTLRIIRHCRSQPLALDPPPTTKTQLMEVRSYISNFKVLDNQKKLTQLSLTLEPRRP